MPPQCFDSSYIGEGKGPPGNVTFKSPPWSSAVNQAGGHSAHVYSLVLHLGYPYQTELFLYILPHYWYANGHQSHIFVRSDIKMIHQILWALITQTDRCPPQDGHLEPKSGDTSSLLDSYQPEDTAQCHLGLEDVPQPIPAYSVLQ